MLSNRTRLVTGRICTSGRVTAALAVLLGFCWSSPVLAQCTDNSQCDDGLFCTDNVCFAPGPTGQCIFPNRTCSDGLFCNGSEVCDESRDACEFACVGGTVCTSGFCVCSVPGTCPNGNEGTACDITVQPPNCGSEVCNETLDDCTECFQNSHCTTAPELRCNTTTGECVECLNDFHCQDGQFCNGAETCNTSTGFCEDASPVQCDFTEFCSELLDRCVECENDTQCNDGLYCNGQEICINDACQAGTPVNCVAIDPTKPHCNESTDSCVRCLSNQHCDDGLACTSDACVFNTCSNTPDPGMFCDDGNFCNGLEQCNANNTGCVNGTPPSCPKTCFQGTTPDAVCTTDAQCGKACKEGSRAGLTCSTDTDCGKTCAGGANNGAVCVVDDECESRNCTSRGLCATGLCRGGCSEQNDQCVQCAADVAGSTSCSDSLFCDGAEVCSAGHQCVAAPRQFCDSFNTDCTKGLCNETNDTCGPTSRDNGTVCDDDNHCTRIDECQSGVCVEDAPLANDPYRCVRIELHPITTGNVTAGTTVEVELRAVAQGCNISYPGPTPLCSSSSQHAISGLSAILNWDPTKLELQQSVAGNINPQDPCDNGNPCFNCPAGQYNWSSSLFAFDCGGDALNSPCSGTPSNDGNAFYLGTSQLQCNGQPKPACVPTTGLYVTKFKFRVLAGAGTASVSLAPCAGENSLTQVVSNVQPPTGYLTQDVTKALGGPANFTVVSCINNTQCDDGNPCTNQQCISGTCRYEPKPCGDADPCTVDSCNMSNGACINAPIDCGSGNRCYNGECYETCLTVGDCDDGVSCTIDTCDNPDAGADICKHATNDSVCDTGLFCSAEVCDAELDCVPDHDCYSATGNPCPDNGVCNESNDNCGGCLSPTLETVGCRYLRITPGSQGSTPVALLVEGDCNDAGTHCVSKYVQSQCVGGPNNGQICGSDADCPRICVGGTHPGTTCVITLDCGVGGTCAGFCEKGKLGDTPVFLTAAQWGSVNVNGSRIRPNSRYHALVDCNFPGGRVLSAVTEGRTWIWGDTNGDGIANIIDIGRVVNAVKGLWNQTSFEGSNIAPCETDMNVNVIDIGTSVDTVKGIGYSCPALCP